MSGATGQIEMPQPRIIGGSRYLIEGDGPPVVLIHGVGMDLSMWDALAALLRRSRRVIRYDMQGHGQSEKPTGPYRLADFTRQLARLATDLDLPAFDLVGFSMGGLVAQAFALHAPNRVRRMVLVNTVFNRTPAERLAIDARVSEVRNGGYAASVAAAIDRWFTPSFRTRHPEVVENVRWHMMTNDLEAYAAAYAVFGSADAELADRVAAIHQPSLVITGSDDQRSTALMAHALAISLPAARLEIIDGQRHLTPLEIPGHLAGSIDHFLSLPDQQVAQAAS
ncbi:MAG TPA: alpha/beta fold hydrolase [Terriglobales bacterium]|nr:alpha/beta fold hydrolase [Terriglobales bacterium]